MSTTPAQPLVKLKESECVPQTMLEHTEQGGAAGRVREVSVDLLTRVVLGEGRKYKIYQLPI